MRAFLQFVSFSGLALTIFPALLTFSGVISMDTNKSLMLTGMVLWFASAPLWIHKKKENQL
jgi:hypothetical protein